MPKIAIIVGLLLTVLGAAGYVVGMMDQKASWTALIPAFAGVPILFCGVMARNPECRKHAMHGAVLFGLLGFLAPLGRLVPQMIKGSAPRGVALVSMLAMIALCGVFVVLCVRSFIEARRERQIS